KSDYVAKPLPKAGRAAMIAAAEAPGSGALLCDAYGGAISRVAPAATAFVHRHPLFCIQYYGNGATAAWIDQAWTKMRPYVMAAAIRTTSTTHSSTGRSPTTARTCRGWKRSANR